MNMNVNNGGQSIQQRIDSLKKSQEPQKVEKPKVKTGMTGPTFEERRATFEQQPPKVEKPENLLDKQMGQHLENAIDQTGSESMRQRSSALHDDQGRLGYGYESEGGEVESHDGASNYLIQHDKGEKEGYGYHESESSEVEGQEGSNYLIQNKPGEKESYGYQSYGQGSKPQDKPQDKPKEHVYDDISDLLPPSEKQPIRQQHGLEPLDPGSQSHVDSRPKKHEETAQNHHPVLERGKSNVDGVQRGFEFALAGQAKYTVMFSSKESQKQNQLSFGEQGVTRGDSETPLSTQSPSKGQWAGSKADRMLFVMSPQGEFYTIDPKKPIDVQGATVMDVRIHHSSLLDGQDVSGAGEIQVSAGLTPEEVSHLQSVVQKRLEEQIKGQNLQPEAAQKLLGMMVNEELGRLLKNHQGGQIEVISDRSGHYRPSLNMTAQVLEELESRGVDIDRVNVELGDKTNTPTLLEGELMVPSRAVIASKNLSDGEAQLRNQQARKSNMQEQLLGRTSMETASPGHKDRVNKLARRIGQLITQAEKSQNPQDKTDGYEKAALVYERRMLMIGVHPSTKPQSGQSLVKSQEEAIRGLILADKHLAQPHKQQLLQAYDSLLQKRHAGQEMPEVEDEEGGQQPLSKGKPSEGHIYDEIPPLSVKPSDKHDEAPLRQDVSGKGYDALNGLNLGEGYEGYELEGEGYDPFK